VKLELGVRDNDLEVNQVSTHKRYCTGIPNHVVLLASRHSLVLQQENQLISDNASIPLLVQNALQEGGGGDDYNKVVHELKMISKKLTKHKIQKVKMKKYVEDRNEEDGSRYTSTMQINLHLHEGEYIPIHPDFIFPKKTSS